MERGQRVNGDQVSQTLPKRKMPRNEIRSLAKWLRALLLKTFLKSILTHNSVSRAKKAARPCAKRSERKKDKLMKKRRSFRKMLNFTKF